MWKMLCLLPLLFVSSCASFPEEEENFRFAATAPLRDFNVLQIPIPGQLNALHQPYGYIDQSGCEAWSREITELETALTINEGRRVGFRRDNETFTGRSGNLRDSGVAALASSAIPFRSVVRQVSGAARLEQRAERASDRARYRIGYLVGLGRSHRCPGFGTLPPQTRQTTPVPVRQTYSTPHPRVTYRSPASVPHGRVPPR
jgi:hypothetical protein